MRADFITGFVNLHRVGSAFLSYSKHTGKSGPEQQLDRILN
jgi:hypothetical protein